VSRCRPRNNRGDVGTETETFLTGPFLVARSRRVIYSREKSVFNSRDSSAFDGTPRVPSFMAELRRVARKAIGQKFVSLARTTKNDFSPENCTRNVRHVHGASVKGGRRGGRRHSLKFERNFAYAPIYKRAGVHKIPTVYITRLIILA